MMDPMDDMNILDRQAFTAEMALDEATVTSLYQVFAEELASDLSALRQVAKRTDVPACVRLVHKIKGTSGSYRATRLRGLVGQADTLLAQGEVENALRLMNEIAEAGSEVISKVAGWQE